jgi:CheY-like chemotaxis protein
LAPEKVKKKILVVDDEPDTRIFISNLLDSDGFSPVLAEDKTEGLRKAIEEEPAVIIIDMMMPGEGGIQMYRNLKREEKLKDVPVIMLSTIDRQTFFKFHIVRGSYSGKEQLELDTYLEKPPEADELLKIVRDLAETWASSGKSDGGKR